MPTTRRRRSVATISLALSLLLSATGIALATPAAADHVALPPDADGTCFLTEADYADSGLQSGVQWYLWEFHANGQEDTWSQSAPTHAGSTKNWTEIPGHVIWAVPCDDIPGDDPPPGDVEVSAVAPTPNQSEACGVQGSLVVDDTEGVIYRWNGVGDDVSGDTLPGPLSGSLVAEAADGYVLVGDSSFPVNIAAAEECPEEPDEDVQVGGEIVTRDDDPDAPDDEIGTDPELEAPAEEPVVGGIEETPTNVASTGATLPRTGLGAVPMLFMALGFVSGGVSLVQFARRNED